MRVYGGGAAEEEFLSDLEKLIGDYNRMVASPSAVRAPGGGSTSTSWQLTPTPILTVADLAALPRDRIIVMPSGAPPVLAQPDLLVEQPPRQPGRGVDRGLRPARRSSPAATPRHPPGGSVDDTSLNGASADALAGAGPLVEQTVRSVLEQHVASMTRKALDRRAGGLLDAEQIERLALKAAERQLADLADPPGLYYLTLGEWVAEWLFPVYRRSILGHDRVWCPQWWRHAEAVARLEALWRAWEHLRQDPATGLSVWFRDHADHHMTVLLDADGPFKGCDGQHSEHPLDELPHDPPPEGMFEPEEPLDPIHAGPRATATAPARTAGQAREHTIRRGR